MKKTYSEALWLMSKDINMMEAHAPITNEPILNITEHEENTNVSLG